MKCASCHTGPNFNFQFSKWRLSKHAEAWAVLGTPKALEIAKQKGVNGNPQQAPECLKCHATAGDQESSLRTATFDVRDGVQCESCHGPGSEYANETIMRDKPAARQNGLQAVDVNVCLRCHEASSGEKFDFQKEFEKIAHPTTPPATNVVAEPVYKNPMNLCLTPDGKQLWVACEASSSVVVVDTTTQTKVAEIPVGGQPNDVCFTPDGRKAFVSNRLDDSVSVIDVPAQKVIATIEVGDEPHGLLVDPKGRFLYVLNTSIDNISVVDVETLREVKRIPASRSPWSLAVSPDGELIVVTHALSRFVPDRTPSMSEVTVIDTTAAIVVNRVVLPAANLLQG
ncbi:MAG: beta-propeller fold lactonase family protein, partial [Verrucomicrobiae bacterium]|nr:beta-propeller fold lactonase family protein [Verrucomicrobiae bacterium]